MSESIEEKARRMGVPVIPRRRPPPTAPYPHPQGGPVAICGECGLELHRTMGYCCPHANCPCGLGHFA